MTIKWTVSDAIKSLTELTNPFEQAGIGPNNQPGQRQALPRVEDVIAATQNNNRVNEEVIS